MMMIIVLATGLAHWEKLGAWCKNEKNWQRHRLRACLAIGVVIVNEDSDEEENYDQLMIMMKTVRL